MMIDHRFVHARPCGPSGPADNSGVFSQRRPQSLHRWNRSEQSDVDHSGHILDTFTHRHRPSGNSGIPYNASDLWPHPQSLAALGTRFHPWTITITSTSRRPNRSSGLVVLPQDWSVASRAGGPERSNSSRVEAKENVSPMMRKPAGQLVSRELHLHYEPLRHQGPTTIMLGRLDTWERRPSLIPRRPILRPLFPPPLPKKSGPLSSHHPLLLETRQQQLGMVGPLKAVTRRSRSHSGALLEQQAGTNTASSPCCRVLREMCECTVCYKDPNPCRIRNG